jgi:hypothetical protein
VSPEGEGPGGPKEEKTDDERQGRLRPPWWWLVSLQLYWSSLTGKRIKYIYQRIQNLRRHNTRERRSEGNV